MKIAFISKNHGFTLVELLVTLALMTFIFGVLFSMISGGLRVWQRLQCGVRQEHEVYLALDQMRRGLQATRPFELIPFKGAYERIDFSTLLNVGDPDDEEAIFEPGQVSYYFDRKRMTLCESQKPFRGSKRNYRSEVCKVLAQNVSKVNFSFSRYNANSKSISQVGSWSDKQPPVSVKIELEYHDPCSEKQSKKEFLVSIPVGPIR